MKQVFVISGCHILNDVAYCSKRIKEYVEANCIPSKDILTMVVNADLYKKAHITLKKQLGHTQTMFYDEGRASYICHDIHHVENSVVVLMLDENTTLEVVRALTHMTDFEISGKGIELFTVREPCRCEYSGEL